MTVQPYTDTPQQASLGFTAPLFGHVIAWAPMGQGDSGQPTSSDLILWLDRTFQVDGNFGAGGTLVIEGTNDGVIYHTLHDPQGNLLALTQAGISQVTEVVLLMRPRVTAGDGTTSLTVTGFFRRSFNG